MMERERQLELQAYFDGELPEREAARVKGRLATDPEAQALLRELEIAGDCLSGAEDGVRLPETREFYWSKIERAIARAPQPVRVPAGESLFSSWRRVLIPVGAVAVVMSAFFLAMGPGGRLPVPGVEAGMADPATFTYRDFAHGTTLVWLSYPAENEFE